MCGVVLGVKGTMVNARGEGRRKFRGIGVYWWMKGKIRKLYNTEGITELVLLVKSQRTCQKAIL